MFTVLVNGANLRDSLAMEIILVHFSHKGTNFGQQKKRKKEKAKVVPALKMPTTLWMINKLYK